MKTKLLNAALISYAITLALIVLALSMGSCSTTYAVRDCATGKNTTIRAAFYANNIERGDTITSPKGGLYVVNWKMPRKSRAHKNYATN